MIRKRLLAVASCVMGVVCAAPASAQLHLPQLPPLQAPQLPPLQAPQLPPVQAPQLPPVQSPQLPPVQSPQLPPLQAPQIPALPELAPATSGAMAPLQVLDRGDLIDLRRLRIRELLRQHPQTIELDPAGEPIVRNEIVAVAPSAAALEAARAQGFTIEREQRLDAIDLQIVILRAPPSFATAAALARMREIDPQGAFDFDHIYLPAGELRAGQEAAQVGLPRATTAAAEGRAWPARVGLIDGGVDSRHAALLASDIHTHGCNGELLPDAHGTGVASLLVGRAPGFAGAAPAATLYAADVYCGRPTGGEVEALVEALAWMAREQVPVVNISLVGPANRMLERALRILMQRGQLIVAAVGNDGPAAPPLYPAAYSGVVGVTAVDAAQHVLPEAARGPQVAFAAPGADMAVAANGERGYTNARGTSFAAPIVAGLLASAVARGGAFMDPAAAQRAVDALASSAIDLGPPGRDEIYGYGLVGAKVRADPRTLR